MQGSSEWLVNRHQFQVVSKTIGYHDTETHIVHMLAPVEVTVVSGGRMHGVIRMQGLVN